MATPTQVAAQLIDQCRRGFDNEHHHGNWLEKHSETIIGLPDDLRAAVLMAWIQATHKAFSHG